MEKYLAICESHGMSERFETIREAKEYLLEYIYEEEFDEEMINRCFIAEITHKTKIKLIEPEYEEVDIVFEVYNKGELE